MYLQIYIHICVYVCMYVYMYIYRFEFIDIYINRYKERETDRDLGDGSIALDAVGPLDPVSEPARFRLGNPLHPVSPPPHQSNLVYI